MGIADEVRSACAAVVADARHVRLHADALDAVALGPPPALDADVHYVEGPPAAVAAYVLTLDAINFGSGWFADVPGVGYEPVARGLSTWWRTEGALDAAALRAVDAPAMARILGLPAGSWDGAAGAELLDLYARALRELGAWLGDREALAVVQGAEPSAERLVALLATELPMWRDHGFLKRAQIAASDLALAGVARFADVGRLTAFADNVLPQVLRHDGVLEVVDDAVAAAIDRGEPLPAGSAVERELRAAAVHACELLAARSGLTAREVDNVLWTRGQAARYAEPPLPHRTRTTYY